MEPYARAYLQFLTCAAGSGPDAEAFVFATRLTRLTRALASRNPERAIQRAAAAAPDWSSGTRIGDALKQFNDRHGRRGMARGAVVVILSDGWERGDPTLVWFRFHGPARQKLDAGPTKQHRRQGDDADVKHRSAAPHVASGPHQRGSERAADAFHRRVEGERPGEAAGRDPVAEERQPERIHRSRTRSKEEKDAAEDDQRRVVVAGDVDDRPRRIADRP